MRDNVDKFFGETFRADALTAERITDYRKYRLAAGTHEPTLAHELRSLKTALRPAPREGNEKFAAMLTELPAYLKPLVRFLYFTGMRVMEAAGLT